VLAATFALAATVPAQIICGWDVSTNTTTPTTVNATTRNANLTGPVTMSLGSGLTAFLGWRAGYQWSSGGHDSSSGYLSASNLNTYVQFTLTPAAGYTLEVDSLKAPWWVNSSGTTYPVTLYLASSLDNYTTPIGTVPSFYCGTSTTNWGITLASPIITNIPVTFRFYVSGHSYVHQGFGGNNQATQDNGDALDISGRVYTNAATAVPVPIQNYSFDNGNSVGVQLSSWTWPVPSANSAATIQSGYTAGLNAPVFTVVNNPATGLQAEDGTNYLNMFLTVSSGNSTAATEWLSSGWLGTYRANTTYTLTVGEAITGVEPSGADHYSVIGLATNINAPASIVASNLTVFTSLQTNSWADETVTIDTALNPALVGQPMVVILEHGVAVGAQYNHPNVYFDNVRLTNQADALVLSNTVTTVVASPNPCTNGDNVTFTARVTPAPANGQTLNFLNGTNVLGTGLLTNGMATFTTNFTVYGNYSITASYPGDGTVFNPSSATLTEVVNPCLVTLQAYATPGETINGNPIAGTLVALVAFLSPADSGNNPVVFYDGSTQLGTNYTSAGVGYTEFDTSSLSPGTHTIRAVFGGDPNYSNGSETGLAPGSAQVVVNVVQLSGLYITNSAAQFISFDSSIGVGTGQSVLLITTNLSIQSILADEPNNSNWTNPTNSTPSRFCTLSWEYSGTYGGGYDSGGFGPFNYGDPNNNASASWYQIDLMNSLSVNPSGISTNIPNYTGFPAGQSNALEFASRTSASKALTFRVANLSGATVNGWNLGLKAWIYGSNATTLPSSLTVQTSTDNTNYVNSLLVVTATNSPDATNIYSVGALVASVGGIVPTNNYLYVRLNYNPGIGGGNGIIVDDISVQLSTDTPTTNLVTSSSSTSVYGQPVVLTDTITPAPSGGTVQFYDNGVALGSQVAVVGGLVKLTNSAFAVGSHPITATYSGATGYLGSSSASTLTQAVNQASTTSAVASSKNPANVGDVVYYTNIVTATAPGAGIPSGSVNFIKNGTNGIGTAALINGVAVLNAGTNYTAGSFTITASYAGDANFTGSTNSLTQVVNGVVLTPPTVGGATISGGQFSITFSGPNGQTYEVLSTTNLANSLWITNSSGTFGGSSVVYTNTAPNDPQRFYRIQSP
jgi:hypothetical protein